MNVARLSLCLALAACGGEAILDSADSNACVALEPIPLLMCHGATGVDPSGGVSCSNRCLDEGGHAFESVCSGGSCRCFHDDELRCRCAQATSDACDATCCPTPWQ